MCVKVVACKMTCKCKQTKRNYDTKHTRSNNGCKRNQIPKLLKVYQLEFNPRSRIPEPGVRLKKKHTSNITGSQTLTHCLCKDRQARIKVGRQEWPWVWWNLVDKLCLSACVWLCLASLRRGSRHCRRMSGSAHPHWLRHTTYTSSVACCNLNQTRVTAQQHQYINYGQNTCHGL